MAGSRQIIVLLRVKIVIWERKSPAFEFDSRHLATFMLNLKKRSMAKKTANEIKAEKWIESHFVGLDDATRAIAHAAYFSGLVDKQIEMRDGQAL